MIDSSGSSVNIFDIDCFSIQADPSRPGAIGQVRDIAPIVPYLASHDAGWVAGEIIVGSGGMR